MLRKIEMWTSTTTVLEMAVKTTANGNISRFRSTTQPCTEPTRFVDALQVLYVLQHLNGFSRDFQVVFKVDPENQN